MQLKLCASVAIKTAVSAKGSRASRQDSLFLLRSYLIPESSRLAKSNQLTERVADQYLSSSVLPELPGHVMWVPVAL